jgi:hypothetical protein
MAQHHLSPVVNSLDDEENVAGILRDFLWTCACCAE